MLEDELKILNEKKSALDQLYASYETLAANKDNCEKHVFNDSEQALRWAINKMELEVQDKAKEIFTTAALKEKEDIINGARKYVSKVLNEVVSPIESITQLEDGTQSVTYKTIRELQGDEQEYIAIACAAYNSGIMSAEELNLFMDSLNVVLEADQMTIADMELKKSFE